MPSPLPGSPHICHLHTPLTVDQHALLAAEAWRRRISINAVVRGLIATLPEPARADDAHGAAQ